MLAAKVPNSSYGFESSLSMTGEVLSQGFRRYSPANHSILSNSSK